MPPANQLHRPRHLHLSDGKHSQCILIDGVWVPITCAICGDPRDRSFIEACVYCVDSSVSSVQGSLLALHSVALVISSTHKDRAETLFLAATVMQGRRRSKTAPG